MRILQVVNKKKKLDTDAPVLYFASWHVPHWAQMQSRTHERYNQASERWLTLQTFIRMFPQTQPCQHFISANQLKLAVFFFFPSHVRMCEGVMLAWNEYVLRYQWFQCMCQVGIRKCCYGPHEPILPPPHQQNLIVKSPTCPRATACFAMWPKHSATHVGGEEEGKQKSMPPRSGFIGNAHLYFTVVFF